MADQKRAAVAADIEGARVKQLNGGPEVWLIMDGKRRWISTLDQYHDLFGFTDPVVIADSRDVPDGGTLDPNAILIKAASGDANTYFLVDNKKRVVNDMAKYGFDQGTVHIEPNAVIAAITTGDRLPKT
jgi:hypothetical protein